MELFDGESVSRKNFQNMDHPSGHNESFKNNLIILVYEFDGIGELL